VDTVSAAALDPRDQPLIVTLLNNGDADWDHQVARLERWRAGTIFALAQVRGAQPPADIVGMECTPGETATMRQAAIDALTAAAAPADVTEAAALASSPEAPWRRRHARA